MKSKIITVYAKTDNSKNYVILNGTRDSFLRLII